MNPMRLMRDLVLACTDDPRERSDRDAGKLALEDEAANLWMPVLIVVVVIIAAVAVALCRKGG